MDITGDYGVLHPKTAEYNFVSRPHGTFSRTDHVLGYKVNLGKFKKTEILSNIFSDHNAMRSEINYKKKKKKERKKKKPCKKHKYRETKQLATKWPVDQ